MSRLLSMGSWVSVSLLLCLLLIAFADTNEARNNIVTLPCSRHPALVSAESLSVTFANSISLPHPTCRLLLYPPVISVFQLLTKVSTSNLCYHKLHQNKYSFSPFKF